MNYKELRKKLKQEQIKRVDLHTKAKRNQAGGVWCYNEVRTYHIAQSLFRGHSFEQIEYKWKDEKNPNHSYIKSQAIKLYESYLAQVEEANETICVSP